MMLASTGLDITVPVIIGLGALVLGTRDGRLGVPGHRAPRPTGTRRAAANRRAARPRRRRQPTTAKARTGNVPMPRTAGGAAVNRKPVSGSWSRPVRCSTIGIRAASSQLCAGRRPVCVRVDVQRVDADQRRLRRRPGTRPRRRSGRDGRRSTRGFPTGRCARSRSARRDPPASNPVQCADQVRLRRSPGRRRRIGCRTLATTPSRSTIRSRLSTRQILAVPVPVRGGVQIGAGVGRHRDRPDGELGAGRVVRGRLVEGQVRRR